MYNAENITKLPKGKHSVKGVGKTQPDPKDTVLLDDGVEVPLGRGVLAPNDNTALLYNEYPLSSMIDLFSSIFGLFATAWCRFSSNVSLNQILFQIHRL